MNPEAFICKVREHYLDQFKSFLERQNLGCDRGAAEVKLRLSEESEFYEQLYCADFIKNDEGSEVIELQPERSLEFDLIQGSFGSSALVIEHMRWDDVVVEHDAREPLDSLAEWFERWFDPADKRHVEDQALGNVIHSLLAQPSLLSMDLGSAEPDAIWELLHLLEAAGATSLRITASTIEEG